MTTTEPIFEALRRLEHADIPAAAKATLVPAFAALHGAEAIPLPEATIALIRSLDQQLSIAER